MRTYETLAKIKENPFIFETPGGSKFWCSGLVGSDLEIIPIFKNGLLAYNVADMVLVFGVDDQEAIEAFKEDFPQIRVLDTEELVSIAPETLTGAAPYQVLKSTIQKPDRKELISMIYKIIDDLTEGTITGALNVKPYKSLYYGSVEFGTAPVSADEIISNCYRLLDLVSSGDELDRHLFRKFNNIFYGLVWNVAAKLYSDHSFKGDNLRNKIINSLVEIGKASEYFFISK